MRPKKKTNKKKTRNKNVCQFRASHQTLFYSFRAKQTSAIFGGASPAQNRRLHIKIETKKNAHQMQTTIRQNTNIHFCLIYSHALFFEHYIANFLKYLSHGSNYDHLYKYMQHTHIYTQTLFDFAASLLLFAVFASSSFFSVVNVVPFIFDSVA